VARYDGRGDVESAASWRRRQRPGGAGGRV